MAIVKEYDLGPTHIRIDDSAIQGQTKEEARAIWDQLTADTYDALLRQHLAKKKNSGEAGTSTGE